MKTYQLVELLIEFYIKDISRSGLCTTTGFTGSTAVPDRILKHYLYLKSSINHICTPIKRVKSFVKIEWFLRNLNVDAPLILLIWFRYMYFGIWCFGSKNLGTIQVFTKLGFVSVGLFQYLLRFSMKVWNQEKNTGSNSVLIYSVF